MFRIASRSNSFSLRNFATRSETFSPFDAYARYQRPFLNWKTTSAFFLAGAYLAYSEAIFEYYSSFTQVNGDDDLLRIQLEYRLKSLPIYQKLVHSKEAKDWMKLFSWENLDRNLLNGKDNIVTVKNQEEYKTPTLTNHTLTKPGGILIQPVIFHNMVNDQTVTIVHLGYKLCGFPFIVHGGMIATLLNETFKRNASLSKSSSSTLKDDFKVENLSISYRLPTLANQFLVIKTAEVECNEPNTVVLKSVIESQDGKVLVEGEALLRNTGRASKIVAEAQASKWALF